MQIVLFGQKWLAVEVLRELLRLPGVEVVAVCPDTERDRLAAEARQRGIPIAGMSAVPACDMAVAAYCQKYIPADVRARCGLGVLAYHPSLLPRHRGRDAVRWTIAMREPVAGGSCIGWTRGRTPARLKRRTGAMSCRGKTPRPCGGGRLPLWAFACLFRPFHA